MLYYKNKKTEHHSFGNSAILYDKAYPSLGPVALRPAISRSLPFRLMNNSKKITNEL